MKIQSKIKYNIKNKIFGGEKTLVCIPLVSKDNNSLINDAEEICKLNPDVIEWRVDSFNNVENIASVVDSLSNLSEVINNIPLIFTCRHTDEGGLKYIPQEKRIEIIRNALETGCIDIVDIEMSNESSFISKIKDIVEDNNAKLILSYHNFKETPEQEFIYNKIVEGEKLGGDITKVTVMPKNNGDVLKLINASHNARTKKVNIPIIAISMGDLGRMTRVTGGLFGSDMTFAVGKDVSAPGQIPINLLRSFINLID